MRSQPNSVMPPRLSIDTWSSFPLKAVIRFLERFESLLANRLEPIPQILGLTRIKGRKRPLRRVTPEYHVAVQVCSLQPESPLIGDESGKGAGFVEYFGRRDDIVPDALEGGVSRLIVQRRRPGALGEQGRRQGRLTDCSASVTDLSRCTISALGSSPFNTSIGDSSPCRKTSEGFFFRLLKFVAYTLSLQTESVDPSNAVCTL